MSESLSSPIANGLALTLLHFLWQGLLIGLGYWALLTATGVRTARVRYATSLLALAVMALCPPVTFAVVYDSNAAVDETATRTVATSTWYRPDTPSDPEMPQRHHASETGRETENEDASRVSEEGGERVGFTVVQRALDASQPYVLLLWLAGVMLSGARLTAGFLNVIWLRSGRTIIPSALADRSLLLARRLGLKHARIYASARIREAAVVGFWRPVVLLPASWLALLPTDVLEAVMAHELAHIRRYDVWVNLLQRVVETLLFYHPAVWWLSNRIRVEREMCCDELAVEATGERGIYAMALEQVGRLQVRGNLGLAASFAGDRKMKLLSRVQNVLKTTGNPQREPAWLVGVFAIVIPLLVLGAGGFATTHNAAIAQERDGARSAEGSAGPRRSAEGEGKRRSAEAKAGPRRSAERERGARRSAEGGGSREGGGVLKGFRPQTKREAALYQMILQLQRELATIRSQMQGRRSTRHGETGERVPRDGEGTREIGQRDGGERYTLPQNWQYTRAGKVFKAYDKNRDGFVTLGEFLAMTNGNINAARRQQQTKRFFETRPGSDEKLTPAEFIDWYTKGRTRNIRGNRQRTTRDGEGGRSAEAEAAPRRSAEGKGRRSPEAEAKPRRSAEGEAGAKRGSAERGR